MITTIGTTGSRMRTKRSQDSAYGGVALHVIGHNVKLDYFTQKENMDIDL